MKTIPVADAKFPVRIENISDLTGGMPVINTERSGVVVGTINGQDSILGVHSSKYSLVPNELLFDAIHKTLAKYSFGYEIGVTTHNLLQFNIGVIFNEFSRKIGTGAEGKQDIVKCSFNVRNAYDGKLKFGVHGIQSKNREKTVYRMSSYRMICQNGLHGWVDEAISFEQYIHGLKKKNNKVKYFEAFELESSEKESLNFSKKHSGIHDLSMFIDEFSSNIDSLAMMFDKAQKGLSNTFRVYDEMADFKIENCQKFVEELSSMVGNSFPKKLHEESIRVMYREMEKLDLDKPNAWLIYNGVNRALSNSSKSIAQVMEADEQAFNAIAQLVF